MVTSSFTQLLTSDEFRKRGLKGIKEGGGGGLSIFMEVGKGAVQKGWW